MDVNALEERRISISHRLDDISIPIPKNVAQQTEQLQTTTSVSKKKKRGRRSVTPNHVPDDVPSEAAAAIAAPNHAAKVIRCDKTDTHWDFLLKEMKWLAADFQAERKRHLGFSKKMAVSATVYCEGAAARELKSIQDAAIKQRKLAARIARECTKKFWSQIHRVITYKQKVSYDTMRHNAMNQQLVQLVQQTEKYTALLSMTEPTAEENNMSSTRKNNLSIEQALANSAVRRSKNRVRDYARLLHDVETTDGETSYYGESTDDNSGSDATYVNEEDDISADDESTLRAAEMEEWRERHSNLVENNNNSDDVLDEEEVVFEADPIELQLLQEEAEMDIQQVLERLNADAGTSTDDISSNKQRQVQFLDEKVERVEASEASATAVVDTEAIAIDAPEPVVPVAPALDGCDADDDMDASDVDDYDDNRDVKEEDDGDYVLEVEEVDDETTLEQEELLPRDMPPEDEIRLLQEENEMSVEELRKLYSGAFSEPHLNNNVDQSDVDMEEQLPPSAQDDMDHDDANMEVDSKMTFTSQLLSSISKKEFENLDEDEEEYVVEEAVDDETTMEAEEKMGRDMSFAQELSILKRESEMSVDELRAMYSRINDDSATCSSSDRMETTEDLLDAVDDQENDEEFVLEEDVPDDESTLEAEARMGPEINPDEEIALLKRESELPIEDLRKIYDNVLAAGSDSDETPKISTGHDDKHPQTSENASALMPKASIVSRPFLIPSRVKLREYQHVGLSWLVSLQSRRLNGILADGTIQIFGISPI